jgi:hypothetical protein
VSKLTPEETIKSVLVAAGIKRVVSVDDHYDFLPNVADVQAKVQAMDHAQLRGRLNSCDCGALYSDDPETLSDRVVKFWTNETAARKVDFLFAIGLLEKGKEQATDARALSRLPTFFTSFDFEPLGLPEWRASKEQIIKRSAGERTLLLFDEDLRGQGGGKDEGLTLIKEALALGGEADFIAGLVSHNYHLPDLHDKAKSLVNDHSLPQHKFTLIPKELLIDKQSATKFAGLIKLTVVTKPYAALIERARKIFIESVEVAGEQIKQMTIYDLDEIIFQSSYKEGVWEPNTLFRLLGIFHRGESQTRAFEDPSLRETSTEIRRISGIETPFKSSPSSDIFRVQHMENYEDADRLNNLHRPTELGDIYEDTNTHEKYILIAPQCDLMVRKEGYRGDSNDILKDGVLAQIVRGKTHAEGMGWKLDFYVENEEHFVDFKTAFVVRLMDLDLCVFNSNGAATFTIGPQPSPLLIPAWEKRHGVVKNQVAEIVETYRRIAPQDQQADEINRLLTRSNRDSFFKGKINPETANLEYGMKRVMRLLTPRSTALIGAYSKFLDRDAFQHTFA